MSTRISYLVLSILLAFTCLVGIGPAAGTASADAQDVIWGVAGVNFTKSNDYSEVFQVDVATGDVTVVASGDTGSVGNGSLYSDIALTPNGNVYALGLDWDGVTGSTGNFYDFYRLDPVSGQVIGSWVHVFPDNGIRQVNALCAESDSSLLAIEGGAVSDPHLVRINLDGSGNLASVVDLGQIASGVGPCGGDLDVDPFTGKWYGTFEGSTGSEIWELDIDEPGNSVNVSECDITYAAGLAFLLNGSSVTTAGSWHDKNLYSIDVETGYTEVLYDLSPYLQGNIFGLSSRPEQVTTPAQPTGPATGDVGQSLSYTTAGATSNLGHALEYRFDWGDGTFSSWSSPTTAGKSWSTEGTYEVRAQARCSMHTGIVSPWSTAISVTISAVAPTPTPEPGNETISVPDTPSGSTIGSVDQILSYATGGAESSLGHPIEYRFDWGTGSYSAWSSSTTAYRSWAAEGTYDVRAQARCATHTDVLSAWSDPLVVEITYVTSPDPPAPPSGLIATAVSSSEISLSWQDNSTNELGFIIDRKNREKGYFHEIGRVGAEVMSYEDTDVEEGNRYYYRVKSWNYVDEGFGPVFTISDPSNVDDAVYTTGGGCFVASAAFGSYLEPSVQKLRTFRDGYLNDDVAGQAFVSTYYSLSPAVAEFINDHSATKPAARAALLPAIGVSTVAADTGTTLKLVLTAICLGLAMLSALWLVRHRRRPGALAD